MLALLSLFTWLEIALAFLLFFPFQLLLFIVTAPFDRKRVIMHYHSGLWCALALAISPLWKIKITGREHLDRSKAHVVIINHQSLIDVLIAFRLFYPVKMIGKKILAWVPIVGWNLYLSGHLMVDRSNTKSQFAAIRKLEALLLSGNSILVFPEGTRTKDGELGEFKKGAFKSAASTGTALLPVVIDGPFQILPKKGFIGTCRRDININILPPIEVLKDEKPGQLAERSRAIMATELARLRAEPTTGRPAHGTAQ